MSKTDIEAHNSELKVVIVDTEDTEDKGICWVDVYSWDHEYNDWEDEPVSCYSNIEADASDKEKKQYAERILKKLMKSNPKCGFEHNVAMAV